MNILIVCRGKSNSLPGQVVMNQVSSLKKKGLSIQFFIIGQKGVKGYLQSIFRLNAYLKNNRFDVVHAHYSFSGFAAGIAGAKPLVVSLMGSDIYQSRFWRVLIRFFSRVIWDITIVKTNHMSRLLKIKNSIVLPNGVDLDLFRIIDKEMARKQVGLTSDRKYILFVGDPERYEKNISLARMAVEELGDENVELLVLSGLAIEEIPLYLNAADLLLLTSLWEGSPNIVKEALACNLPIVSTDVGDVRILIDNTESCYLTSFEVKDVADKLRKALLINGKTNGRQRIIDLGLDSGSIAGRLVTFYKDLQKQ